MSDNDAGFRSAASKGGAALPAWEVESSQAAEFGQDFLFRRYEDPRSELSGRLRERYALDRVVEGVADELTRILLLRAWLRRHVAVDFSRPAVGPDDLIAMLDAAPAGGGYHCSHFMIAQDAVMNAFGLVTRRLGAGPGGAENTYVAAGHHGVNEIWSNQLCKWILSDAEEDCHFEKGGVPLSALEVREEYLRDGAREVIVVKGPERRPMEPHALFSPHAYAWISWDLPGERRRGELLSGALVVLDDEYFRRHTWNRWTEGAPGVRPHYAHEAGLFVPVRKRELIEWTPNVLDVRVDVDGDAARFSLFSSTPNLREYQRRLDDGEWEATPDAFELPLGGSARECRLRAVNAAGVVGPETRLRFAMK